MYVNQRPQEVINAINDKFEVIMNHEKEATTAWVNMGKANETIFLGGKTVKSKDAKNGKENVGLMSIDSEAIFQKILIGRCVVSDGDDKCGHKPTFLDLGTGDGKLLEYLHSKFGIEYDRMIGISAGDHRMVNSTIPNQSYVTFNIDLLNQTKLTTTSGASTFDLIASSFTFYHLVDPIGVLSSCYEFLSDQGGLAIIRQFPFSACVKSNMDTADLEQEKKMLHHLNTFWKNAGFNAVIIRMLDSPGNCMVVMKRMHDSPSILTFPYSYSGALTSTKSNLLSYRHTIHEIRGSQESLIECFNTNDYDSYMDIAVEDCIKLLGVPICLQSTSEESNAESATSKRLCILL